MTMVPDPTLRTLLRHELDVLQGHWVWYVSLGVAQIICGFIATGSTLLATLATVSLISVLLILGGIAQAVGAYWARRWSGFFALLITGILYVVVGLVTLGHPLQFSIVLTLVLAVFLMVGGSFRIVAALALRFPHWGWVLCTGVVTLLMGILIWRAWPSSSVWVIGLFIGIEMIFNGWTWVMFALTLRSLPRPTTGNP